MIYVCATCKKSKRHDKFSGDTLTICDECRLEVARANRRPEVIAAERAAELDRQKEARLRYRCANYGITIDDYHRMHADQDGRCPICLRRFSASVQPNIDHCHTTGRVRGLLCQPCNTTLGMWRDDRRRLLRAVAYLRHARLDRPQAVPTSEAV